MYSYSAFESVKIKKFFFIWLNNALQNKGYFSLNSMGKFVIHYRLSGWVSFFPVLSLIFICFTVQNFKLFRNKKKIYELKTNLNKENSDQISRVLLVNLAYSLTAHYSRYKLNLEDKLISLKLDPNFLNKLPIFHYPDYFPSFYIRFFFRWWNITLKIRMEREKECYSNYSFI